MAELDRDYITELQTLGECILSYSKISSEISTIMSSSKDSVDGLYEIGWQGEAKETFKENFDTWLNDTKAFNDNIVQLEDSLKTMYENVTELKDEGGRLSNCL